MCIHVCTHECNCLLKRSTIQRPVTTMCSLPGNIKPAPVSVSAYLSWQRLSCRQLHLAVQGSCRLHNGCSCLSEPTRSSTARTSLRMTYLCRAPSALWSMTSSAMTTPPCSSASTATRAASWSTATCSPTPHPSTRSVHGLP